MYRKFKRLFANAQDTARLVICQARSLPASCGHSKASAVCTSQGARRRIALTAFLLNIYYTANLSHILLTRRAYLRKQGFGRRFAETTWRRVVGEYSLGPGRRKQLPCACPGMESQPTHWKDI